MLCHRLASVLSALLLFPSLSAQTTGDPSTWTMPLSGLGPSDAVPWEFRCDEGRGCGEWTAIEVPSQWELQGFGTYDYGHVDDKTPDCGVYRRSVEIPASWTGRRIELVFEGVMTDATVRIDGAQVGPTHRGGFYRFSYDLTDFVRPGATHMLEVEVEEESSNASVNAAERDADYWTFGGIYRPVWLRALPSLSIDHVAVDARHDGALRVRARIARLARVADEPTDGLTVEVTVRVGSADQTIRTEVESAFEDDLLLVEVAGTIDGVEPWSAEWPTLYDLVVTLRRRGEIVHRVEERIGFRTVELRPFDPEDPQGSGLFVNGRRTLLRGVNRHAFWPSTGRAIDPELDRRDAERIRAMNLNAVRTSHYPPNEAFLDACDELGIYVIDELAGWHDAYDTKVGRPLVRSMVERDVNHPSILLWSNGNEDGWNTALDDDFARHDLQDRHVLHPRSLFRGVDTDHYDDLAELDARLDPTSLQNRLRALRGPLPLVLPTEILHGLYDGGSSAGLDAAWDLISTSFRGLGLFLWSFTDEAVVRTDRPAGSPLDADGNHAPDGILGPYRESSAHEESIRRVFAPVQVRWNDDPSRVEIVPGPGHDLALPADLEISTRLESAQIEEASDPGWERGRPARLGTDPLEVDLGLRDIDPEILDRADVVHVEVRALDGRLLGDEARPLRDANRAVLDLVGRPGQAVRVETSGETIRLLGGPDEPTGVELDERTFALRALVRGTERLELTQPVASGTLDPGPPDRTHWLWTADLPRADGALGLELLWDDGPLRRLRWLTLPSGWTQLAWTLEPTVGCSQGVDGLVLPFDPERLRSIVWEGHGPHRIWGNQRPGPWGRHAKEHTSDDPKNPFGSVLRGYHRLRHASLETTDGTLHLAFDRDALPHYGRVLGLLRPEFPGDAEDAVAQGFEPEGLAFLDTAPPIGTKFHPAHAMTRGRCAIDGPGPITGSVWLLWTPRSASQATSGDSEPLSATVE